jgi:hypothetical protein
LEGGGCLFSHGLPCWDAAEPAEYYLGDRPETEAGRAAAFAASPCRVSLVGHFHRWPRTTLQGPLPWGGAEPVVLGPPQRCLVVVAAVRDGWCALFSTDTSVLTPLRCLTKAGSASACLGRWTCRALMDFLPTRSINANNMRSNQLHLFDGPAGPSGHRPRASPGTATHPTSGAKSTDGGPEKGPGPSRAHKTCGH